jgi:putative protease
VIVDVACRNTVFNDAAQSAALLVPDLLARGVRRFRVELVREGAVETRALLAVYGDLLAGRVSPRDALARAGAAGQVGVSPQTMAVLA